MTAELVSIGTELALGQALDTNSAYLARKLASIGMEPSYIVMVGNFKEHIREALVTAMRRSEVIILTGGLGATELDHAREVVSELTDSPLVYHEELMAHIEEFFHRVRSTPSPEHQRQAFIPEGSVPIQNPVGSAPGFILRHQGKAIIALSGIHAELRHMVLSAVVPFLVERFGIRSRVHSRLLKLTGLEEPLVGRELGEIMRNAMNPVVGLVAYPSEVHIRLTARADHREEAMSRILETEAAIRNCFGDFIYGADEETLENVVARLLRERDATISVVETFTSGLVCDRLYRTGEPVLKEGRVLGLVMTDTQDEGKDRVAEHLSGMIRETTGASLGLAAVSETSAGVERTSLWVAVTSSARKQITTSLMARRPEVNQARAVAFCLDQVRRFVLAEGPRAGSLGPCGKASVTS